MDKIKEVQKHLQKMKADGWLLYDFHYCNDLTRYFLNISPKAKVTRRFFYWIPASGEPIKLLHAIEPHVLEAWPGKELFYNSWQSMQSQLKKVVGNAKKVAMEYSPMNAIPTVSKVDAGTIELVRSFGAEVVSSGSFLPHFTAVLTEDQGKSHVRAGKALDEVVEEAWQWIAKHLTEGKPVYEHEVQAKILSSFKERDLETDGPPIVAVNEHSADPHYGPSSAHPREIKKGDFILIDLWAKEKKPGSVFGDITRVGVAKKHPTPREQEIFSHVRNAQKAAVDLVCRRFKEHKELLGWEVDECARNVIRKAGYGDQFIHRTGHNIEEHLHGSGANIDNLETHDERPLLPSTCFSIEPGIYLPNEFGVRLEHDLYVHSNGTVEIVGGEQDGLRCLF